MRAVVGAPATVRLHTVSDGGAVITPDALPTVTVTAGDGVTVLYSNQAGTLVSPGSYAWMLPAQAKLDQLTAAWSFAVGGLPYTVAVPVNVVAGRLADPYLCRQGYANLTSLSDEQLLWLIDEVEDLVEDVLGFPPVLAGTRQKWDVLRGTLTDALYISGTVNGLPYGWGAGRMLIPGVKFPVVGNPGPTGTANLGAAITAGVITSLQLVGDTRAVILSGYSIALTPTFGGAAIDATATNGGTYNGTTTTYTVASVTAPTMTAGAQVAWAAPVAGPGAVYSGSINGVALDPVADIPHLIVEAGALAWSDYRPWISGRYQIWVTHGLEAAADADLRAAARKLVSYKEKTSNYPERAAQVVTEGATILFSMPGPDHPTGIPDIDAVLTRRRLENVI